MIKNRALDIPCRELSGCKGTAKIRVSERNEKIFSFLSVRILFKSKTIQNKIADLFLPICSLSPSTAIFSLSLPNRDDFYLRSFRLYRFFLPYWLGDCRLQIYDFY